MKKLFCLMIFAFVFQCSIVSAVGDIIVMPKDDKETVPDDEFIFVKNASQFALNSTDDYADIINNNLALVATGRVKDYKKYLDRMSRIVDSVKDNDAKYCAWFAESILTERLATLEAYIKFAECYSAGDRKGCENYNTQIKFRSDKAFKLRKEFADLYNI